MQIGFNEDEIRAFLPSELPQAGAEECNLRAEIDKLDMNKQYSYPIDLRGALGDFSVLF